MKDEGSTVCRIACERPAVPLRAAVKLLPPGHHGAPSNVIRPYISTDAQFKWTRRINAHMADYLMPVNLDIPQLDAHFVEEDDPHVNPLGVKGLGEIALVGMAPAITNAVFHATGKRIRHLPILIEDVLGG